MNEDMIKTLKESEKHRTKHPYWVWESVNQIPDVLTACLEEPTTADINALVDEFIHRDIQKIFLLGRGSSYFLTLSVKYLFDHLLNCQISCEVTNVFEAYNLDSVDSQTAVFFHSHSGKSEGDLKVVSAVKRRGALTVGVTDNLTSPLAKEVDNVLFGPGGSKVELPATRTYASAMFRMMRFATALGEKIGDKAESGRYLKALTKIPDLLKIFIPLFDPKAEEIAKEAIKSKSFVFVGFGPNLSTADESAMAFSQATGLPSLAYEMENYIHGPMQALTHDQCVVVIAPEGDLQGRVLRLAQASGIIGASTLVLAPANVKEQVNVNMFVEMPADIPEIISPIIYMVPLWQIGYRLSLFGKGGHPDRLSMDKDAFKEGFSFLMKKDKWVTQK